MSSSVQKRKFDLVYKIEFFFTLPRGEGGVMIALLFYFISLFTSLILLRNISILYNFLLPFVSRNAFSLCMH